MTDIEQLIEEHLLEAAGDGWIQGKVICALFDVNERQLRTVGDSPGLCSGFAISGNGGFKHVTRASRGEFVRFKGRLRKHAISELRRVKRLDRRRHRVVTRVNKPAFLSEKDSNQGLLFEPVAVPYQRPW